MFTPGSRACGYKSASGLGKWPNQDPIGERGGLNLYGYVGNNPVNWFDPLGLAVYPNNFIGPLPPGSVYQWQQDAFTQQAEGNGISSDDGIFSLLMPFLAPEASGMSTCSAASAKSTASSLVSANVRAFIRGEKTLNELTAAEREAAATGYDLAASQAKNAVDAAFRQAQAAYVRGEGSNPGTLSAWRSSH